MHKRDFLSITDLTRRDFLDVLHIAASLKKKNRLRLKHKTLMMITEQPDRMTQVSFTIAMTQLGGHALPVHGDRGESVLHAAALFSCMADCVLAATERHQMLVDLAKNVHVPVINGLSDLEHPCQVLADVMTIAEHKKRLTGLHLAFIGDGENNVTHSLALASGLLGMHFTCVSPKGHTMRPAIVAQAKAFAKKYHGSISLMHNGKSAVKDADVVYGDYRFLPFAKPDAIFMQDKKFFDGRQSVVYQQAENRLHAQKGLLVFLLKRKNVR